MSVLSVRKSTVGLALVLVLTLGGVLALPGAWGQPGPKDEIDRQIKILAPAMAKKLKHSQDLLAALAVEDFERIGDSARMIKKIDVETLWKVSPNLNYVKYSAELAAIADELARSAKDADLNACTLAYVRMTINCVDCHKFVRDNRILDVRR